MKNYTEDFDLPPTVRGLVYICVYDYRQGTIEVRNTITFSSPGMALEFYSNTPNPESQLAMGKTQKEFEKELKALHDKLSNPKWVKDLAEYL